LLRTKQEYVKIEQLIVQHLYNNKSVTLQGIGTIRLNPSVALPTGNEKDFVMPENAFSFEYNLKAQEDPALIDFIVQQTRKIRPLATSDMESYSILAKQFLNIGKPLIIQGIGTILKNQDGNYEFTPGNFVTPRIIEAPKPLTERIAEPIIEEHTYETDDTIRSSSNKKGWMFLLGLVTLGLIGGGIYYFTTKQESSTEQVVQQEPSTLSTQESIVKTDSTKMDSSSTKIDTISHNTPTANAPVSADGSTFKIAIKQYDNEKAVKRAYDKLTEYGHTVSIVKVDSTTYRLVMSFNTPLSDTTRARDSLRVFFGGKPFVVTQ